MIGQLVSKRDLPVGSGGMRLAGKSLSVIVFVSAIALSYAFARFFDGVHTRIPATLALPHVQLVKGTIYPLPGDPRTADPAHIAKQTGGGRGESSVFTDCAPAYPGNLTAQYHNHMCSQLRRVDRNLYLFAFTRDEHQPQSVLPQPSHH